MIANCILAPYGPTGVEVPDGGEAGAESAMAGGPLTLCGAEALRLLDAEIGTAPIWLDGSKTPSIKWGPYQDTLPTAEQIRAWHAQARALAAICGAGSGNLEALDCDDPALWEPFCAVVERSYPGLVARLVIVQTPGPGFAGFYRHDGQPEGNTVLAEGLRDRKNKGRLAPEALFQTRGHGGYELIPPSSGRAHPTGRPYRYVQGDLADVPTITAGERRLLLWCARSFDELPAKRVGGSVSRSGGSGPIGDRPGDHYNQRGRWADLLKPRGWRYLFTHGRTQYWQRPAKDRGWSATVNHKGTNRLHVFSTSCAPLEADTSYSLFGAYTVLEHGGDFAAATRALAAQGYGRPRERRAGARSGVRVYSSGTRHRDAARRRGSVIVTGRSRDVVVRV